MMNINKQQNLPHSQAVVLPMRFYANWDVDRTSSPIAVQRNLSMVFTRLVLTKTLVETENTPITIAVRLQNSRRILRSNDLSISPSRLDTPLDISFTIQYCHFIKRKQNILQILIQRRKRYKNRQIPGFKTLAMGHLNLDEILQFGGSREVVIWDTNCLRQKARHSMRELHAGKIFIANCYTQAADSTDVYIGAPSNSRHQRLVAAINEKEPVMSEEEQEEFSSVDDSESENDYTPRGATNNHPIAFIQRRQKKFLKQRNIKQRVIALLRKFKPDEEAATSECPHTSRSIVDPPTEQELQEIFEELGNISDSGPELEPDKLSIISNPRPKIRPFFGSKSDIMPPIEDFQNEEGLFLSDEITDDSEIQSSGEEHQQKQEEIESNRKESGNSLGATAKPTNYVRPLLVHSETVNSITLNDQRQRMLDPVEELLSKSEHLAANQIIPEHLWICSSADLNWIAKINPKMVEPLILLDCPSSTIIRSLLQTIIAKIQNFCNNNSMSPPTTTIGVLGGDHLLANILKAYVHLLQDKACKEDWLNYLRFSLVLPPNCAIGRLLSQVAGFGGYSEAIWKVLSRVSKSFTAEGGKTGNAGVVEHNEIRNCLVSLTRGQSGQRCTNLQIGEVMLSGPSTRVDPEGKSQVFVPFLAELLTGSNVGNEQQSSSFDPSFSSLYFIRQNTIGAEDRNAECLIEISAPAIACSSQTQATSTSRGYPTQHSQSSPSIPALTIGEIKDMTEEDFNDKGNTSPPRHVAGPSAKNSPAQPNESSRELQIEYWTVLSYPCNSTPNQQVQQREDAGTTSNVGSKFSMKASVRTLSIAREPMSNLLSILFVKERKKDKVLQKLGRKSKQKSIDTGAGFCPQSRVVSGVTRIVCTSGSGIGGGKKDTAMDLTIDGVLWRQVRFFQIGAQWQTHVKLFPVSFPMELPVTMPM